jgi:hypothetical protein
MDIEFNNLLDKELKQEYINGVIDANNDINIFLQND